MRKNFLSILKTYDLPENLHEQIMFRIQREYEKRVKYRLFLYMFLSSFVLVILSFIAWYIADVFFVIPVIFGVSVMFPFWARWVNKMRQ